MADAYAAQRLELRALRDRMPPPPRDLWARTAAAIESEARFRDGRTRPAGWRDRRALAPSALLATALVVAVAVGTLTSSQRSLGDGDARSSQAVALAPPDSAVPTAAGSVAPGATPIPAPRTIAYLVRNSDGEYSYTTKTVSQVCPSGATQPCATNGTEQKAAVNLDQKASTVIGAPDDEHLIVISEPDASNGGSVSVVSLKSPGPVATATPTPPATSTPSVASASPPSSDHASPSLRPSQRPSTPPVSPSVAPSVPPTASPVGPPSPTPSVTITPAPDGSIEIAHDVILVGQSAAYSVDGRWFAFTARPADGSAGPDIYVWKVGEALAHRVTDDQRSVFGSWAGDRLVGSTVVATTTGNGAAAKTDLEPASFLLDPATAAITALPQTGKAWRPAVDARSRFAVYWTGTLRTTNVPGFAPDKGRLVLGDWSAAAPAASDAALPTALTGDQSAARHETTIGGGRLDDWDARWDSAGTHLAVWIADSQNPAVGRLTLYAVDSFDGRIDLKAPLLDARVAAAGFSLSDGKLVWAEPGADGSLASAKIQLLAWTDDAVGTVETVTGPVIVVR